MATTTNTTLLQAKGLQTEFVTRRGRVRVLADLDLSLIEGRIMGLVGESGSGKTVTAYSLLRLIQPPGEIVGGEVWFQGRDLMRLCQTELNHVRGGEISMIFQQPRASLNPVFRVGEVLHHVLRVHRSLSGSEAREEGRRALIAVGLPDPDRIIRRYPHELSGGMCQRVMIALALACQPRLLIADEPTTALDVTIQMQIVELLLSLRERFGLTQILITHDLGLVAELCDDVAVMYAGEIVEQAPVADLFDRPSHPYTHGLLASRPQKKESRRLYSIPGRVPDFVDLPSGCRFHPRCPFAQQVCEVESPKPQKVSRGHWVRCHFWEDVIRSDWSAVTQAT
jgi:oligopeptide/dipeptide ABC transporter ATP-binding protein